MNNTQHHKLHRAVAHNNQHPIKMAPSSSHHNQTDNSTQRILFGCFYMFVILLLALYVTAYYFYQHNNQTKEISSTINSEPLIASNHILDSTTTTTEHKLDILKQELEARLMFVEGLVNVLTGELQDTQQRLREREKCDCSISCTFNGTRFADKSSWQNQCDTCTCQSGKISCLPRKCPILSCDDQVQLPGQCCPVCMKQCKYNSTTIRHGQKFTLKEVNKECKCQDGRIKCEQLEQAKPKRLAAAIRSSSQLKGHQQTVPNSERTNEAKANDNKDIKNQMSVAIESGSMKETISGEVENRAEQVVGEKSGKQQTSGTNGDKLQLDSTSSSVSAATFDQASSISSNLDSNNSRKRKIENG